MQRSVQWLLKASTPDNRRLSLAFFIAVALAVSAFFGNTATCLAALIIVLLVGATVGLAYRYEGSDGLWRLLGIGPAARKVPAYASLLVAFVASIIAIPLTRDVEGWIWDTVAAAIALGAIALYLMHSHIEGVESRGLAAFEAVFAVFAAMVGISLAAHSAASGHEGPEGDHGLYAFLILIAACVLSGLLASIMEKRLLRTAPRRVVIRLSPDQYTQAIHRIGAEETADPDEALRNSLRKCLHGDSDPVASNH